MLTVPVFEVIVSVPQSPMVSPPGCSCERLTRLYEQGAPPERIGDYVRRWQRWLVSGLGAYRDSVLSLLPGSCDAIQ